MAKTGEQRTIRITKEFGSGNRGSGWEVSAVATIDQNGEAEANVQGPIFVFAAETTGEIIRRLQQAAEWAIEKRDELLKEREAPQTKAVGA